jgi:hypothetical protein|tara:strand:- start:1166 stop:1351 length:186 start_codon:yes stop_codon:yes gene_type:complete
VKKVNLDGELYIVLGTMSIEKSIGLDTNDIKTQWRLADIVLRNGDMYYICMKALEAEFEDI